MAYMQEEEGEGATANYAQSYFRDERGLPARIALGSTAGPGTVMLRAAFLPAGLIYGALVTARDKLYDFGLMKTVRLPGPAVSVGNISAGGTGKTPMVEWVAGKLLDAGKRPAIISRGYGAKVVTESGEVSDEAALLAANLNSVPHRSNPRREIAAKEAAEIDGANCFVLDDGFQHRRVFRGLDIVLFDASVPQRSLYQLPFGCLREPMGSLKRAGAVVLTHVDLCPKPRLGIIRSRIASIARQADIAEAIHKPVSLDDIRGEKSEPPESLSNHRVFAFCGVGNPNSFASKLEQLGARVVGRVFFPDHHPFTQQDVSELVSRARECGAELCVTTQKDAVKIAKMNFEMPVHALKVKIDFVSGEDSLLRAIRSAVSV